MSYICLRKRLPTQLTNSPNTRNENREKARESPEVEKGGSGARPCRMFKLSQALGGGPGLLLLRSCLPLTLFTRIRSAFRREAFEALACRTLNDCER